MKRWIKIQLLLLISLIGVGQDAHFSMFYSNSLYLAPSFAGSTGKNRISANYRNQWPEAQQGFITYSVSFDHHFEKLNSGFGVLFFNDVAGTGNLSTTNIGVVYSYDFNINHRVHIRPGLNLLYTQRGLDFNRLIWGDQMSAGGNAPVTAEPGSFKRVGAIDFAASVLTYGEGFWAGATIDHLLQPNQSLYYNEFEQGNLAKIPMKYSVFGGTKHIVNQTLLRPIPTVMHLAFLYKQQGDFSQLDLGFYYYYNPLVLGLWYRGIPIINNNRKNDAVILLVGLKTDNFNIGYSYDVTVSRLITSTGGSHEFSISYTFSKPSKKRRPKKMVPCPEF
jgi:type IX secretion system PorP/SprF family membrane protein